MLKIYFKIAYRLVVKHPSFSLINTLGLSVGLAAFIFIFQYVTYQHSFDTFHTNADRIYRVWCDRYAQGELQYQSATTYPIVGETMKNTFPEVVDFARLYRARNNPIVTYEAGNKTFNEDQQVYFADPSLFQIFSINILEGDKETALLQPNEIFISKQAAQKYFGSGSPLGKELKLNDSSGNFYVGTVKGVFENLPTNSHIHFDILFSKSSLGNHPDFTTSWENYAFYTYVLLAENYDAIALEKKLKQLIDKNLGEIIYPMGVDENLYLQPIADIHLYADLSNEASLGGNPQFIQILLLTGIFVLLIAWMNYINLSTAKATTRSTEVGIKKVVGASKKSLVWQFLAEAFILNLISIIISLLVIQLISIIFPSTHTFLYYNFLEIVFWLSCLTILGTLLSGFYPAMVLASFKPVSILRGKGSKTGKGKVLRKALVSLQLAISIVMLIATFVVFYQVHFMKKQPLGFNLKQKLIIKPPSIIETEEGKNRYDTYIPKAISFKNLLKELTGVTNITESGQVPGNEITWTPGYIGLAATDEHTTQNCTAIDRNFWDTYGIDLITGRNFSEQGFRNGEVIINEASAKVLGFTKPEDAIGVKIYAPLDIQPNVGTIVGVVSNYHQESLQKALEPIVFVHRVATWEMFTVQLNSQNMDHTLDQIRTIWEQAFPGNSFDFFFLDDFYNRQYQQEQFYSQLLLAFSLLSVLIACLGLIGMITYTILLKNKEIGIRKVLGASVSSILVLLSKEYIQMMSIAFLIAIPIANYFMMEWLQQFAYHIEIEWWLFIFPALVIALVVGSAISGQSIKAALKNPVDSLRSE